MTAQFFTYISSKMKGYNVMSKNQDLILERRFIINYQIFGLYLHKICSADSDPNLFHDHPWSWSFSVILSGYYIEQTPSTSKSDNKKRIGFLNINWIDKNTYHRISNISDNGVWTLYFRGKKIKKDGFLLRSKNGDWTHILDEESDFEYKNYNI